MSPLESSPEAPAIAAGPSSGAALPDAQPAASSALGRFRYDCLTDTWWWSDEMFAIHGLGEGTTQPTTDLIVSLNHPEDRRETEATLRRARESGQPFTQPHRLVTPAGALRHVITVGEGIFLDGRVVAVHGYLVDVTASRESRVRTDAWDEASKVIEQRAVIERAKGALMVRYGLDADAAFEVLRGWSSTRNEKLRDVARHVVENLSVQLP